MRRELDLTILQVVHALPSDTYGGSELYTKHVSEALAARGHDVAVAAPLGDGSEIEADVDVHPLPATRPHPDAGAPGTPVERARRAREGDLDEALAYGPAHGLVRPRVEEAFVDVLDEREPDVVHFQHLKGLSARLPRRCPPAAATMLTLHDFWTICEREQLVRPSGARCKGPSSVAKCAGCHAEALRDGGGDRLQAPVAWRQARLAETLASLDRLVAPSRFLADRFERFAPDEASIVQLRNGIHVDALDDTGFDRSGPLRLGYAGRITEAKGLHVLLAALDQVEADVRLDVWGRFAPDEDDDHARLAASADERVRFHGRYAATRTPYAEMDVFVLPSIWPENSPLVLQEAFAANVPVVVSDLGGMAELVTEGRDGLTFPVGDAEALADVIQGLAEDPRKVRRLRRGVSAPKSLDDHVGELERLYAELSPNAPVNAVG